jgi:hypothetical protein
MARRDPNNVGRKLMHKLTDTAIGVIAALLVLFSAMIDPRVSATLALLLLVGLLLMQGGDRRPRTRKRDRPDATRSRHH